MMLYIRIPISTHNMSTMNTGKMNIVMNRLSGTDLISGSFVMYPSKKLINDINIKNGHISSTRIGLTLSRWFVK
jgi:hypothetical protein